MLRYLHSLSAAIFYCLGGSFFLAYLLFANGIAVHASRQWLETGDLPLLCIGLLYGGLSVYRSVTSDETPSKALGVGLGAPLVVLFVFFVFLKFTTHYSLPTTY